MYKIILTLAALLLITTTAIAGDKPITKVGPCIKACVQPFNPAINDVGADANISVDDFNAADCVAACKSPLYDASCGFIEDGCCAEPDSADPDCGIVVENWHIELSDGNGTGDFSLTKDSNGITMNGSIVYNSPYGNITLSIENQPVSGASGEEFDVTVTGTANAVFGSSPFDLTLDGVVSQGRGIGEFNVYLSSWYAGAIGTFNITRTDGSGITPETGTVEINEGANAQYLICISNCSTMRFAITNISDVPTTYNINETCVYNVNTQIQTCEGEALIESTGITYNYIAVLNWDTCTIGVNVDGIGFCQTN